MPWSWYYGCELKQLWAGPVRRSIGGRPFVIFRTKSGTIAALDARCVHLGADLSRGQVVGECLRCPFHEWAFGTDGRCTNIPASPSIPEFAMQASYPTVVRGGHVFVFNSLQARFDMPCFDTATYESLHPANPIEFYADIDWPLVAGNGFDLQHFRAAHDRTLVGEPIIDSPSTFARRIRANFLVTGKGWRDRLTEKFSGRQVEMSVTCWSGTLILVMAKFRRTTSYGMVCVTPLSPGKTRLQTIVWVPKSRTKLGRMIIDPIDAIIRRSFIKAFMRADQDRLDGTRYNRNTLIGADAALAAYFDWLQATILGEQFSK